jgi:hypothetical protein
MLISTAGANDERSRHNQDHYKSDAVSFVGDVPLDVRLNDRKSANLNGYVLE